MQINDFNFYCFAYDGVDCSGNQAKLPNTSENCASTMKACPRNSHATITDWYNLSDLTGLSNITSFFCYEQFFC